MKDDGFLTIKHQQQAEIKVKGSRFIATAKPVISEQQARNFITQISRKFYDATHNCWAYVIGHEDSVIARSYDNGEPVATAGQPILNIIQSKNLTNIAVVVTRYFGGTKLGKGGLIRAYSDCTREVLNQSSIIKKYLYERLVLEFAYDLTGAVMRMISKYKVDILESDYSMNTRLKLSIRKSKVDYFKFDLTELTSGKVILQTFLQRKKKN